jgi:phage/plasmid primase-like uncharacterized protein
MDVATIKQAARGRWSEILAALGGIPAEVLDGQHHACPRCGGIDRFRAFDDFQESGGVYCNQCHAENNGDGISTLQWVNGIDFQNAIKLVAGHLGVQNGKEHAPTIKSNGIKKTKLAESAAKIKPTSTEIWDTLLQQYAKAKPPITPEGVRKCGGTVATWGQHRCIRLDGRAPIDATEPTAIILVRIEGQPFSAIGKLVERKTHTVGGSVNSWLSSGTVEKLQQATTIIDVEGVTDLLAVVSSGLPSGWIAVTNTAGAKARGKLPRKWANGKRIIVAGDADEPGQDGQKRSAAAYHKAGATEIFLARLPFPIEKDHGKDIRDFLNEGHKVEDLPTEPVTAEQIEEWNKTSAKPKKTERITNAIVIDDGESKQIIPIEMGEIIKAVLEATEGSLRRIDKSIFVHHLPDPSIYSLDSVASLFGFFQSLCGVNWHRGASLVGKEELFCELQRLAPAFAAVETIPHWPPIPTHYYTCPIPEPGDGSTLTELIGMHCLETDLDQELAVAMYATAAWGGAPGMRPAWLVTASAGRGKGKTRFNQNFARVFGGQLDISPQEDIGAIKQRLLSPEAAGKRIATIDNLKALRFSWGDFENLVTASVISGKRMYIGEGSRPNLLVWTITLNGASLSTDMAQRVVEIRLREPDYDGGWEERVAGFIDTNREKIIADCIAFLQHPAKPMKRNSRWAAWEAQVLSKVDHPDDCLSLILDRRGAVDVELQESEIIEDHFAHMLAWLGYSLDRDDVFIPNDLTARWYNSATGESKKVTGVSLSLRQLHDEGRLHRIVQCRAATARGFRWVGQYADASDVTHHDIRERLAAKEQEQRQPNSGENRVWK